MQFNTTDYFMNKTAHGHSQGIPLKKKFGQHFLREQRYIDVMISRVELTSDSSIFEIGCGDGFLTRAIQKEPHKRFWVFEIDHDWASYVQQQYPDPAMVVYEDNILDVDFSRLKRISHGHCYQIYPIRSPFHYCIFLKSRGIFLKRVLLWYRRRLLKKLSKKKDEATVILHYIFNIFLNGICWIRYQPPLFILRLK